MTIDRGTSVVVRENHHALSFHSVEEAALSVGVEASIAARAAHNVTSGAAFGVLFSGSQGAGKDTVAPAVLARLGVPNSAHCGVSHAIKDEMDVIIAAISSTDDRSVAVRAVADAVDLREDHAEAIVSILWSATRDPQHGLTGRTRTPEIRLALQYHGHEARIDTHPGYWISACYRRVVPLLAEDRVVYLTDGRFPAEVEMARRLGLYTVRLLVSPEVQFERIMRRDGHAPDPASLQHASERLLDDYDGFHLMVDNSRDLEETVKVIAERLARHNAH
jgi:hypothetical protein